VPLYDVPRYPVCAYFGDEYLYSGTAKAASFFTSLGAALDGNHGKNAIIHMRQCNQAAPRPGTKERPMLDDIAKYSGHAATGCDDTISVYDDRPGPDYGYEGSLWVVTYNKELRTFRREVWWWWWMELFFDPPY
jgi:hypothetical protein